MSLVHDQQMTFASLVARVGIWRAAGIAATLYHVKSVALEDMQTSMVVSNASNAENPLGHGAFETDPDSGRAKLRSATVTVGSKSCELLVLSRKEFFKLQGKAGVMDDEVMKKMEEVELACGELNQKILGNRRSLDRDCNWKRSRKCNRKLVIDDGVIGGHVEQATDDKMKEKESEDGAAKSNLFK